MPEWPRRGWDVEYELDCSGAECTSKRKRKSTTATEAPPAQRFNFVWQ
jgi:hypothetical protein